MNQSQLERQYAMAAALNAALYDKALEDQGTTIRYFFDADVVIGALFAYDELDKDLGRNLPLSRSIVRALWVDGFLPVACLTLPHLDEVRGILARIRSRGGISEYLAARRVSISRRYGLAAELPRIHNFRKALLAAVASKNCESVLESMGLLEFAAVEAEVASQQLRDRGFLLSRMDVDGDLGETQDLVTEDARYDPLLQELTAIRKTKKDEDPSSPSDVAALIALSRLGSRTAATGARVEYRFYTNTTPLRSLCENSALARQLMTIPGRKSSDEKYCTDTPWNGLRSSTYFIVRASWPCLAFGGESTVGNTEDQRQRTFLTQLANALGPGAAGDSDLLSAELRGAIAETDEPLLELTIRLRDKTFTRQLLTDRQSAVRRYLAAAKAGELLFLGEALAHPPDHAVQRIDADLRKCEVAIEEVVHRRSAGLNIAHALAQVDPWPAEADFAADSALRWCFPEREDGRHLAAEQIGRMLVNGSAVRGRDAKAIIDAVAAMHGDGITEERLAAGVALLVTGAGDFVAFAMSPWAHREVQAPEPLKLLAQALYVSAVALRRKRDFQEIEARWRAVLSNITSEAADCSAQSTGETEARRCLAVAWASVYVMSAVREEWPAISTIDRGNLLGLADQAIGVARRAIGGFDRFSIPRSLAWACELLIRSDIAWLDSVVKALNGAMKECALDLDPRAPSNVYVRDAFRWAVAACWKREQDRQYDILLEPGNRWDVVEPFQKEHRDLAGQDENSTI